MNLWKQKDDTFKVNLEFSDVPLVIHTLILECHHNIPKEIKKNLNSFTK